MWIKMLLQAWLQEVEEIGKPHPASGVVNHGKDVCVDLGSLTKNIFSGPEVNVTFHV